jgi:hypothetical protein
LIAAADFLRAAGVAFLVLRLRVVACFLRVFGLAAVRFAVDAGRPFRVTGLSIFYYVSMVWLPKLAGWNDGLLDPYQYNGNAV